MPNTPGWYYGLLTILVLSASFLFLLQGSSITGFVTGSNITTANVTAQVSITNAIPSVSAVIDPIVQPAAGNTITVFCNVTVTDSNGGGDITTINASLYDAGLGESSSTNNYSGFVNSSCAMNAASGNVRTANCTFRIPYYAYGQGQDGDFICKGGAVDSSNAHAYGNDPFHMAECVGVFINPGDVLGSTLSFGSVAPGGTAANRSLNVSNYCNTNIDLLVQGINLTSGANTLIIRNVSYTFVPWNVAANVNVTHVGDEAGIFNSSFDLSPQQSATYSNRSMWFNVTIPSIMPSGSYVGALNFTVQKG